MMDRPGKNKNIKNKIDMMIGEIKIVKNIFFVILTLLISSCHKDSIEKKIRNRIEDCNSNKCKIVISQLTEFKWDKMMVSNRYMSPEAIESAIGTTYANWENNTRPMIFLYKNKIVYYENNEDNFEHILNNQVIFHHPDSVNYQIFTPQTAVFTARKIEMSYDEHYFELNR